MHYNASGDVNTISIDEYATVREFMADQDCIRPF